MSPPGSGKLFAPIYTGTDTAARPLLLQHSPSRCATAFLAGDISFPYSKGKETGARQSLAHRSLLG